ncbi:DUF5058 family protein [Dolosigranulum pigrum]|uniref:DUF5058 domain-containing protein n=1 Tax=Dolosigranulum pigrum TaxID=29394 RepID=A0A1S8KQ24_9LACT|nr:DUF5058 family protein [Dolosigranulum pigrum]OOL81834.1 DUF5058 domain-containing protein [Dolosigranulum pigrum]QDO90788.1 DUF5058 family protein [Dolosigranulum pigrum]QTJ55710.1 DUF5058 family protein [Dolosigranulum pigrum]
MNHYLNIANHPMVFILCALLLIVVITQTLTFMYTAYKRGQELAIETHVMQQTMKNAALFSIVPTLPIILMMFALAVPLGQNFAWLRLSIVGSAVYEGMAANIAAQNQGLADISDPGLTPKIYVVMMFVMTIGIIWGILFNIIFMKQLDKLSAKIKNGSGAVLITIISTALFSGMLATLSAPYVANIENKVAIFTYIISGVSVLICHKLAQVFHTPSLKDFSLPIALVIGMLSAIIITTIT